jgi:hypothetical protein
MLRGKEGGTRNLGEKANFSPKIPPEVSFYMKNSHILSVS